MLVAVQIVAVLVVGEYRPVRRMVPLIVLSEVLRLVLAREHGIVDDRAGDIQPSGDFAIDSPQPVEIDNRRELASVLRRGGCYLRVRLRDIGKVVRLLHGRRVLIYDDAHAYSRYPEGYEHHEVRPEVIPPVLPFHELPVEIAHHDG